MPACPRDNQYSTLPPPGFTNDNVVLKSGQVIELLEKVIDKFQRESEFIEQQSKQTDLLVSIAQLMLLSTPISSDDKRNFLNNILTITQTLLTGENNTEQLSSINSCSLSNENNDTLLTVLPPNTSNKDDDGDFSLDDLANEYLQNEPTPSSLNDKPTTSSESEELDLALDHLNKSSLSSSPSTPLNEPIIIKPLLESILFSNRLSSHDAADDADCIWKEESSPFGQMFCTKIDEIQIKPTKRVTTCVLDHSLYERLTRLINLLPKQCIRNSVQQPFIRHNEQPHRPQRQNNDNRRPMHRPSFQQNSSQANPMPRHPPAQNSRPYGNSNYPNQQGNFNGYFVDRRSQQQQQNRYPQPSFTQYPADQQYQQKGPPRNNNSYNNGNQQQNKKPQGSNQYQQRGVKKGSGGGNSNKVTNEKSDPPGSGPSLNPK